MRWASDWRYDDTKAPADWWLITRLNPNLHKQQDLILNTIRARHIFPAMTDPFSISVGALSVLGAIVKTSQAVIDFVKGTRGAPESVSALSDDVVALREVL